MPPSHSGSAPGLSPGSFGHPGSIPGGGVFIEPTYRFDSL